MPNADAPQSASETAFAMLTDGGLDMLIDGRSDLVNGLRKRLREAENDLTAATVEKQHRAMRAAGLPCGATVWPAPAYISSEQWAATGCTCILPPGHADDCVCECKPYAKESGRG